MTRHCGVIATVCLVVWGCALAPARALTQEEVLSRRLDKMRQAEPDLREAERNRQAEGAPPKDASKRDPAENADPLPIPEPVRGPVPEPKADLWGKPTPPATTPAPPAPPAGKRNPKAAAALAVKAARAVKAKDYTTALARLNEAVAADPEDPELYNNRGNVLLNSGNPRAALADYDRAISMKPSDAAFFTNRGLAHEKLGNQDAACADYQSACDLGDCAFYKGFREEGHCR